MPDATDFYTAKLDQEQSSFMRRRAAAAQVSKPGPARCGCGAEIPIARREHGYDCCVDCAAEREDRVARLRARGAL